MWFITQMSVVYYTSVVYYMNGLLYKWVWFTIQVSVVYYTSECGLLYECGLLQK